MGANGRGQKAAVKKTRRPARRLGRWREFIDNLQHLRQLRALRTARIVDVVRNVLWAVDCKFIEPIDHLGITATLIDEARQSVTAVTPALFSTSSLPIRSANMIAPSRGMNCSVAHGCVYTEWQKENGLLRFLADVYRNIADRALEGLLVDPLPLGLNADQPHHRGTLGAPWPVYGRV
jgi:hypothetical protein